MATVSGNTVTIVGIGQTTITASQSGNGNYAAATDVPQTLTVNPPLLAGWDFQTTTSGGTAAAAVPNSPATYVANFGTGTIYLNSSFGSSTWITATTGNEVSGFGGTAVNAGTGFSTSTSGVGALALLGGTSQSANGKYVVFKFSMANRKDLVVSYATQRTGTGFNSQLWEYSTDGTTWHAMQTISSIPASFATTTLNTITGLDNASTAYLRLTVSGATSSTGNNRLDNIQLTAAAIPTPTITGAATYSRNVGTPLMISVTNLLATYTSPSGLSLSSVGTPGAGTASISGDGKWILYTPSNPDSTSSDSFGYTVADSYANTASGTVTVTVAANTSTGSAGTLDAANYPASVAVKMYGVPNYYYDVQRATDVGFTQNLTTLVTAQKANGDGLVSFTDNSPPSPSAFYRLKYNHQ